MTFRSLSLCTAAVIFVWASPLAAQQLGPISGGTVAPGAPVISPENGAMVGDGAILHGGVTVEGGYDSNVFYKDTAVVASPLLRITPFLDFTNTSRSGQVPSGLFFDVRAAVAYREYLSSDSNVTRLRAFMPTASATLEHNSNGTLAFGVSDTYSRIEDAPYTNDGEIITRDNNLASAQLRWLPGGGRIQGILRLTNTLDWFETNSYKPANSMGNDAMLDVSWRWLPKTALYLQVRQGYIFYLNNNDANAVALMATLGQKSSSFPLRAVFGIRGLITEKTSIALAAGYQSGFYSAGATPSGVAGSIYAAGELTYLPLATTRITIGAKHSFQNSIIGNFYYDDGAYLALSHQTTDRFVSQLWGSYDHKQYYGLVANGVSLDPRIDNLFQAGAVFDYYMRSWAFAGVSYTLSLNRSDFQPQMMIPGTNYTKHQVFARLGLTY